MRLRLTLAVFLAAVIPVCAGIFSTSATFPTTVTFPVTASNNGTVDSVVVTGAGQATCNGTYVLGTGTLVDHPHYNLEGKPGDISHVGNYGIYFNAVTGWTMACALDAADLIDGTGEGGTEVYYRTHNGVGDATGPDYPWQGTWILQSVTSPLPIPTVTHGQAPGYPFTIEPEQPLPRYEGITNAQKLSLDPASPVGTQASVSDSFYLTGTSDDGFYYPDGGTTNDRATYTSPSAPTGGQITWDTAKWTNGNAVNLGAGTNPWTTHVSATVTNPALQQLAAPSTAQGGVFVSGGTQDGVYVDNPTGAIQAGADRLFTLLGQSNGGDYFYSVGKAAWGGGKIWKVMDADGDELYYSDSDVATPDLASNWKNASDDTPAAITVTSVSQGELDAGVTVADAGTRAANNTYLVDTPIAGRLSYQAGGPRRILWRTAQWNIDALANLSEDYTNDSNVAFPWLGSFDVANSAPPAPTATRNNIAAEANWDVVIP